MRNNESLDEITNKIIKENNLIKHPEGGYYIQTYKSEVQVDVPARYKGEPKRPESTKIVFLLINNDFSAWHKLKSDEIWRFKEGTSLTLHIIDRNGDLKQIKIGDPNTENDAVSEYMVGNSQWFAASVNDKASFSFVECEVRPGFVFCDFKLAEKESLLKKYPEHSNIIQDYSIKEKIEIPNESHSFINN